MRRPPLLVLGLFLLLLAAPSLGAPAGCIVLEDFSKSPPGAFPEGWKVRKEAGRAVYSVRVEDGRHYLHAAARDLGIQAARELQWDLEAYPVLQWKWRPLTFPRGANEQSGRNDSAVGVYAVFPYSRFAVKSVKYIWSEAVPRGTALETGHGLTKMLVLESGPAADAGQWVEERVNVAEDYRRRFNDDSRPKPLGIAVLTDSDDTHTFAAGDYADFEACPG